MATKKWQENYFWEKSPVDSADTLRVKNFIKIALSRTVIEMNAFYAEIQDGHQKWQENDFWEKSPVESADTLRVKICVKIDLCHTISEIDVFLCFTQKFKMAAKNGRENDFWGKLPVDCRYPTGQKFCQNRSISHSYRDECVLHRNSRWPPKMAGKRILGKVASRLSRYPTGQSLCQNLSISQSSRDKCIFCTSKWLPKMAGKRFLAVDSVDTLQVKNVEIGLSHTV